VEVILKTKMIVPTTIARVISNKANRTKRGVMFFINIVKKKEIWNYAIKDEINNTTSQYKDTFLLNLFLYILCEKKQIFLYYFYE